MFVWPQVLFNNFYFYCRVRNLKNVSNSNKSSKKRKKIFGNGTRHRSPDGSQLNSDSDKH